MTTELTAREAPASYLVERALIPTGYKQTEVGVVPEDWNVQEIGQIAHLQRGFDLPTTKLQEGSYPVVYSNGAMNYHNVAMVRGPGVVTGRSGTLGKVHFIETDFWPHNTSLWVTRFNNNAPRFIYYLYSSIGFERFSSGSGVPTLNRNDAHSFRVSLPPTKAEQEAIAEALSDADALIASLERLIAKKRQIKQGAMQELLTSKKRLPGFGGEWEVKRLGELANFFKGRGLPKSALVPFDGKPCIHYGELFTQYPETIREIISRTKETKDSFRSVANDVLMPTSDVTPRGLAKASCVTVDGVILGGDILVIRSDRNKIFGPFLSYIIRYEEEQVLQLVAGSTVFHLYGSDMKKFTLSLPSIEEQTAIAAVLSDMDAEIAALAARLAKARVVKQGMMQELLTGRIRLV